MNPDITIIMPVFNEGRNLNKILNSILNQTNSNYELIIINDGSTDETFNILKKIKDYRIKIINHNKNEGLAKSLNDGLKMVKGKYVTFVDADDNIENNLLEEYYQKITDNDLVIVGFNTIVRSKVIKTIFQSKQYYNSDELSEDLIYLFEHHLLYNVWNKCYRSEIIKTNKIIFNENLKIGQDLYFNFEYLKYVEKCYLSNKLLYNYSRNNHKSMMNQKKKNLFEIRIQENNDFINFFESFKINIKTINLFIAKRFIERLYGIMVDDFNFKTKNKYKYIKYLVNHQEVTKYIIIYNPKSTWMKLYKKLIIKKSYFKLYIISYITYLIKKILPTVFYKLKNKR